MPKRKSRLAFVIFSVIGIFNTLFDIVLYVILYNVTHSIVIANVVATSAALLGSYLLNARLTFGSRKLTRATFIGFVAVTVFGLWVLQTSVIYVLAPLLRHIPESIWGLSGTFEPTTKTVVPKLLATAVTFIWNFVWYNKVIFKDLPLAQQEQLAAETL